jgi:hypothetical protein
MGLDQNGLPRQAGTRCILAALLSLLYAMQTAEAQNTSGAPSERAADGILRIFEERTFVKLPSGENAIVKWETPLRVGFVIDQSADIDLLSFITRNLVNIKQATGHEMSIATQKVNFLVMITGDLPHDVRAYESQIAQFFSDGTDYRAFFARAQNENWTCAGKLLMSSKPAIVAYLLVAVASADHKSTEIDSCVLSGLIQGMGAMARAGLHPADTTFSDTDRLVLNLLYDTTIKGGMRESQATEAVKKIIGDK